MDEESVIKRLLYKTDLMYKAIGSDLDALGGVLRCEVCGYEIPLQQGDAARYTRHGWPKHCDKGMRWLTQKQLADE